MLGLPGLGVPELLLLIVLALIIFGPGKLPEVGRSVGKAIGEFRRASSEVHREIVERPEDAGTEKKA
ncbi:MAG: twin-arginine translocase TatA/TatE family subunit [Peptococcaceae bacterium]|jgi:sec-independent protein translocase protein TatA|nr:twin-arginine translocase TatA/TatE family subunit [Peptococcaceae bacterium]